MILTCPACDTKYVVKDDAIPPGGRQVRCASCKHSWHQDPEPLALGAEDAVDDLGGPPPASSGHVEPVAAEIPAEAEADAMIAGEPVPPVTVDEFPAQDQPGDAGEVPADEAPRVAADWEVTRPDGELPEPAAPRPAAPVEEEEFIGYAPIDSEEDRPKRRWPLILGLIVLIVAAACAFWFLAPPQWKARVVPVAALPGSPSRSRRIALVRRCELDCQARTEQPSDLSPGTLPPASIQTGTYHWKI